MQITWSALTSPADGYNSISDYLVYHDQGSSTYITTGISTGGATSFTLTGLSAGDTYAFRVAGENAMGEGVKGTEITGVVAKEKPETPTNVATVDHDVTYKRVTWDAVTNNGASITAYTVQIQNSGSTMTTVTCQNDEVADGYCDVLITDLTGTLGLTGGNSVIAQVSATNSEGTTAYSATGSGATI